MSFKKGEIYWTDLNPTIGDEINKKRPALVVSANYINDHSSIIVICPITNAHAKMSPIHILLKDGEFGITKDSVVHCGQIRSIDKDRILEKMGNLDAARMQKVEIGIGYVLGVRMR